ncbi:MAG: hypothetical protein B6D61_12355 [Bacteroidetes bacterium 4484_249]|nr:MAG: hypothetical protein B6D61_12355 [Bacteroidetes bacterium 4484_249]
MKKIILIVLVTVLIYNYGISQSETYWSSGSEMIFSFATIDDNGSESGNIMRWAPVFNLQAMFNYDIGKNFGLFTGIAVRNVGYIYDNYTLIENEQEIIVKKKFRTYNLGVPIGIKLGNIKKMFFYGGYEFEMPFHYKEKTFRDEKKEKFSAWFSSRVEQFQHAFIVGIQFPHGANIKFKYYVSSFHNQNYTETSGSKPYEGLNSNIFYFSLNYNLFTPVKKYMKKDGGKEYF